MSGSNSGQRSRLRWGIALLAVQIVLAASLLVLHQREASALPAAPSPVDWTLPAPDVALTVISGVERADPIAHSWREDAALAFVSLQVDWPRDEPPSTVTSVSPFGWLRVVYVAPVEGASSDYAALSMLFERRSGALINASVSAWNNGAPEVALLDGVTVTDETAMLAGEVSGGTAYRAACPERRAQSGISLSIDPVTRERHWNLVYQESGRGASGGPMLISVNAETGDVREVRVGSAECAA